MQLRFFILACILSCAAIMLHAQSECLPQRYSFMVGGGVTFPQVEGNENGFFSKNGNRVGYNLMTEGRYYFTPSLALGLQYDYLRATDAPDKVHIHFARPNITFRHLWSNGNQGAFFSLGIGYMNYQERTYESRRSKGLLWHKGYCGISFAAGYEFRITSKMSGVLRADMLTANWFANPDARLFNPDPYEYDSTNHNWFKNDITFFNLGFALQFGK